MTSNSLCFTFLAYSAVVLFFSSKSIVAVHHKRSGSGSSGLRSPNGNGKHENDDRKLQADLPMMMLEFLGTGPHGSLLGACQGDCDSDEDCDGALVCFQREGGEDVPGCTGRTPASKTDYCIYPDDFVHLPFGDEENVKKELTLGVYLGNEKYGYEGEVYSYCSRAIIRPAAQRKWMTWLSAEDTCTANGINPVTGEIGSDWFSNIDLNEMYILTVESNECMPVDTCGDVISNPDPSDPLQFDQSYNVVATSCGRYHKYDHPHATYYCDMWQVALLERKDGVNSDEHPEHLVVFTSSYGDAFDSALDPSCPSTVAYKNADILADNNIVGSSQFVLQGNVTALGATDLCNWDCLPADDK